MLAFKEVTSKVAITPSLLGLVCSLAVAKELNTQPYTVLESEVDYKKALLKHDKYYSSIKDVNAQYYYETLLTGLLSARLLSDIRFEEALKKPLYDFHQVVAERKDFYSRFKSQLSAGGLLESEQNLKNLSNNLEKDILSWNSRVRKAADTYGLYGATVSGILGLVAAAGVATVPVGITAAAVGLSSTLSNYLAKKKSDNNIVTAVFSKLLK